MKYDKYAVKARAKISQYGSTAKITRVSGEEYDPQTNTYSGSKEEIYGAGLAMSIDWNRVDGKNILAGDVFLMCVFESEPKQDDRLEWGGKSYNVVKADPVSPAGDVVIYWELQLRR